MARCSSDQDPFEYRIYQHLRELEAKPLQAVVVAVSGGPDSTALLLALLGLRQRLRFEVSAFHFNHRLRAAAGGDEEFVRSLCRRLQVELRVESADVEEEARSRGLNIEACARRLRYSSLLDEALRRQAAAVTGHTRDDQAETLLMRLIRGAGVAALGSIRFDQEVPPGVRLIRPLLQQGRQDVIEYLDRIQQDWRLDESNRDLRMDRNWVRRELIPQLRERLNPNLIETLARSAQVLQGWADFMSQRTCEALGSCRESDDDHAALMLERFSQFHSALQAEILREWVRRRIGSSREFGTLSQVTFDQVRQLMELALERRSGEVHLAEGVRAVREFDRLRLIRGDPIPFCLRLTVPTTVAIEEVGKTVSIRPCAEGAGPGTLLRLPGNEVQLRNRRPGDRYRPSDAKGESKLKDLFQKRRVPRTLRDSLVLLESGGRLLWVEGFEPDQAAVAGGDENNCYRVLVQSAPSHGQRFPAAKG